MENEVKARFLENAHQRLGKLERFGNSRSLFKIQGSDIRLYLRYSKIHDSSKSFYGLRDVDLKQLEGYPSFICFLWEDQNEPLIIPYTEYEEVFKSAQVADDGQYKALVFFQNETTELYISRAGRFNVDGYIGWEQVENTVKSSGKHPTPDLSHSQVQTLLGAIGASKDFDVWIPPIDRNKLDWSVARQFSQRENLPNGFEKVANILRECLKT